MTRAARGTAMILALIPTAAMPAVARAHAELTSSTPDDGARLDEPPTEVSLVFDGELLPDGTGFVVTDADGSEVGEGALDLDVAGRNEIRGTVEIDGDGTLTVEWTAVSEDGHPESGTLTFTVGGDASPNTAMATTETNTPAQVTGLALLLVAAGLALRRGRRATA